MEISNSSDSSSFTSKRIFSSQVTQTNQKYYKEVPKPFRDSHSESSSDSNSDSASSWSSELNRQVTTAGQQKVKRLEAELNSSTDSEKNKSKPRNSYVLKLSMIPAPAVPARKLEDFNDPLFARNKTNKESQEINLDRTLTKENSKTLTSKQIKQAASEFNLNIKMEQDIQGLKPYPSETKYAMLSQDNYQNYSSEPKVFKKDTQDKLAYKNIEIQVIKNKNSFDRESLSSIDSRPSVRGPKQNFEFDFDKKISRSLSKNLKEMPRQQSPKGLSRLNQETNEQDMKKFTLSKKYENNSISMSSSSDSDSQKSESDPVNIDEILIKPKVIVPSLKLKLNSDRKKDEKPPVYSKKISISVNKKIPELSSAANFAKKLKNNPEEIQKENPSPIDLNLDSSFEDPNKSEDIRLDSEPKSTLRHIDFEIDSKEVKILHFEDAIWKFKKSNIIAGPNKLWKNKGFFERLCGCCFTGTGSLSKEQTADCEKIIRFSYTDFDIKNVFHKSLLLSVYCSVTKESSWPSSTNAWSKIGLRNIDKDLKDKGAPLGLMLMLFLTCFFPASTKEILNATINSDKTFPFTQTFLRFTDIVIKVLRENRLNNSIKSNNQTSEVICFFYAGIVLYWFQMYNKNPNKTQLDVLYTRTLSKAMGGPNNLIMTAREALKTQSKKDAIR